MKWAGEIKMGTLRAAVALFGLLLVAVGQAWADPPQYVLTDLGALDESNWQTTAQDINNSGQVTGSSLYSSSYLQHAFLWTPDVANGTTGSMQDLGDLGPFHNSGGFGINVYGEVVGPTTSDTDGITSFIWLPDDHYGLSAGINPITTNFNGFKINDYGQIAGGTLNADDNRSHPALWDPSAGLTDLGFPGYSNDINNYTQIVGTYFVDEGDNQQAFLWDPVNGQTVLTPDSNNTSEYTSANGINDYGQVVGQMSINNAGGIVVGFYWDSINGLTSLDYGESSFNLANDINNSGQIVGYDGSAVIWLDGTKYNLNDYLTEETSWGLLEAHAINDSGQIVGTMTDIYGNAHGFLLTPVSD